MTSPPPLPFPLPLPRPLPLPLQTCWPISSPLVTRRLTSPLVFEVPLGEECLLPLEKKKEGKEEILDKKEGKDENMHPTFQPVDQGPCSLQFQFARPPYFVCSDLCTFMYLCTLVSPPVFASSLGTERFVSPRTLLSRCTSQQFSTSSVRAHPREWRRRRR